jgi:hypothetical protein
MAYMAQPSFLIAPDSSGHQFYSARLFTRNPLNEPTGPARWFSRPASVTAQPTGALDPRRGSTNSRSCSRVPFLSIARRRQSTQRPDATRAQFTHLPPTGLWARSLWPARHAPVRFCRGQVRGQQSGKGWHAGRSDHPAAANAAARARCRRRGAITKSNRCCPAYPRAVPPYLRGDWLLDDLRSGRADQVVLRRDFCQHRDLRARQKQLGVRW